MKLDDRVYQTNLSSQSLAIEQLRLSKQTVQKQINDLKIVANDNGYISGLTISEGAYVMNSTAVANILRDSAYEIVLQYVYNADYPILVGTEANIIIVNTYSTMTGIVTKVSDMRKAIYGNIQVVDVTIEANTNGYSLDGIEAKAEINTGAINFASVNQAKFTKVQGNVVRSKVAGNVKKLVAYEGMRVKKGDLIAELENEDLSTSLENANLALQNAYNQLNSLKNQSENYDIISPIDGTITMQNVKVGDIVPAGTLLTSISNSNILEFKIPVDELDVAKLNYDKKVNVTIDALPETKYAPIEGKISLIPLEGITTAGVTDYYVTIELSGDSNIRISMSANADIVAESVKDVLCVPIDAVTTEDGKTFVNVMENGVKTKKEIVTGVSNSTFIEAKEGLVEGEKVVVPETSMLYMPSATSMMQR